jgi:thioredoxin-like negative regulator of GroEL
VPVNGLLVRLLILALAVLLTWFAVWAVRRFIEAERQRAIRVPAMEKTWLAAVGAASAASVHILAFSSQTCRPCYTLQRPALEAISAQKGDLVDVTWIDAPSSPELTQRYHVLTVPTTVVLDSNNAVQAINYGFAPTNRLLEQINGILDR